MPTRVPFQSLEHCIQARVTARWIASGTKMLNVLNFYNTAAEPTADDIAAVANVVINWCNTDYLTIVTSHVMFDSLTVRSMAHEVAPYLSLPMEFPGAALATAGQAADPAWAPLALLNTGYTGRANHGRMYLFPPPAGDVGDTGQWDEGVIANDLAALGNLLSAASTADHPLIVASFTTQETNLVSNVTFSPKLTLQTRRRNGFGDW